MADPTQNPFQVQTGRGSYAINAGQMVARRRQLAQNSGIASSNAQLGVGTGLIQNNMTTTNPLDALMQYLSSRQP